jgi:GntR family transcriptional repressor for pyruvate dehydrogenase complex
MTETAVPPVRPRPRSVSIEIAAHLERLIATGALEPGARLPAERELAAQMHVSRTSLREAMHELERKRLIERRPGFGTVVTMPTAEQEALQDLPGSEELGLEIDDVMELREVLEPRVAGYAAQRATDANVLQLREVIDQWTDDLTSAQYARLDAEFHLLLSQASQNPLFKTLGGLSTEWSAELRSGTRTPNTARSRAESAAEHRAIFEAVAAHDVDGAERAMRQHLTAVTTRLHRSSGRRPG